MSSPTPNFGFPTTRRRPHAEQASSWQGARPNEIAKGSDCNQGATGALSPNADHWFGHAIGRSIRRLTPKPRGSRPSIAALTREGERKVREMVRRSPTFSFAFAGGEQFGGQVGTGGQFVEPVISVAKRVDDERTRFGRIGRVAEGLSPSPWMISRRRWGDGGVQGMIRRKSDRRLPSPRLARSRSSFER